MSAHSSPVALGVNVAGYFRAELGLGEAARLVVAALQAGEVPYALVPYGSTRNRQQHPFSDRGFGPATFPINVICVNADELPHFVEEVGWNFVEDRYTIGFWFWEVDSFPVAMASSAQLVNEIWVASDHVAAAIAPLVSVPVLVFPLPIATVEAPSRTRQELGVPEGFMFLFAFDFRSVVTRKNPLGLVEAFKRAFDQDEGPQLVIKTINGDSDPEALNLLRKATSGRSDIAVIDGYMSAENTRALMRACDAYVSLHRAEGYGLTMAEAMAVGKPVIATGYSGNLAYMRPWNTWLVPYELVAVPPGCDPYPTTARWAEPDLNVAAGFMRRVYENPEEGRALGERAQTDARRFHGPGEGGRFLRRRLATIHTARVRGVGSPGNVSPGRGRLTPRKRAAIYVSRGPKLDAPTRYGAVVHAYRRAVLRAIRHYDDHRRLVEGTLLEAIDQLWNELHALPSVSASGPLETTDTAGRPVIGYRTGSGSAPVGDTSAALDLLIAGDEEASARVRIYADLFAGQRPLLELVGGQARIIYSPNTDAESGESRDDRSFSLEDRVAPGAEAVSCLAAIEDGSLGGIFAMRTFERLEHNQLIQVLADAHRALLPGGVLVVETVNPHSVRAFKRFWLDPRRKQPLYPETLVSVCGAAGFAEAAILFPLGSGVLERDRWTEDEYTLVARRAA